MGIDRNAMGSSVSVAAFWFSGAVANNITTKHALKMVPLPLTVCAVGMLVNILISQLISLGSPARVAPRRTELTQLRTVLPLSCCTAGAFICHRLALASGSVAFTITVKSSNVAITALLAAVSGSMLPKEQLFAVLMVVGGIAIASAAEAPFPAPCMAAAFGSAAFVSLKTVLTKRILGSVPTEARDRVGLYRDTMLWATAVTVPICFVLEGAAFTEFYPQLSVERISEVAISGACLWWMEYGCFVCLNQVSAVYHGINNGLCSCFVIVIGNLVAKTLPNTQQVMGVVVTLCGVISFHVNKPTSASNQVPISNAKKQS